MPPVSPGAGSADAGGREPPADDNGEASGFPAKHALADKISRPRNFYLREGHFHDLRGEVRGGDLEDIDLERYPVLRPDAPAFGLRANVTPYDAAYVGLAGIVGCELWTAGHRIAKSPGPCSIRS